MSLYSALYAGVSGLNAQSSAMATVADNITNVNTVGYKAVTADFSTLVGGGGTNSGDYSAGGVQSVAKQTISQNGLLQAASRNSDIGIDGNGFFVVRNGTAADSQIAYTRAGSFTPDKNGYLVNTGGYYLQGWPIDANGNVSNNPNDMQTVNMYALQGVAEATTNSTLSFNLQSTADPFTGTYTAGDMAKRAADPDASPPVGQAPQFTRTLPDVFDQQGNAHQVNIGFLKTGTNQWQVEIYGNPGDLDPSITDGVLASGMVAFNPDGTIDFSNTDPGLLNSAGTGFKDIAPAWTNGAGADPIELGLSLTQTSNAFAQGPSSTNGGLLGDVADVNVSDQGVVSAVFENGATRPIYQLPLATFANPDGLTAIAGNAYQVSDDSGAVAMNTAGTEGTGEIASKKLEASTADIATEFTNMIRFQRAYSASSKIITTVDQMLQELGNIKA